jgi:hypothetical protein
MLRTALALALLLAACVEAGAQLTALDRLTVDRIRGAGDDPSVTRPVEHNLLPAANADPAALEAALAEAGFEAFDVRTVRGQETSVVFLSDARERTLARQIGWIRENAPLYGFRPTGWTTEARPPEA